MSIFGDTLIRSNLEHTFIPAPGERGFRAPWLKDLLRRTLIDNKYLIRFEQCFNNMVLHEWVLLMIAWRTDRHDIMSFTDLPGIGWRDVTTERVRRCIWRLRKIAPDVITQGIELYTQMLLSQEIVYKNHVKIDIASAMVDQVLAAPGISKVDTNERRYLREASLCFMLIYRPTKDPSVKWSHAKDCARCKADIQRHISIELTLHVVCKGFGDWFKCLICDMLDCS